MAHAVHCADASTLEAAKAGVRLGNYFYVRGDYPSARERYKRALAARERILGPEHPDTLRTLQNLAGTLKAQGDLSGAREMVQRVVVGRERKLGTDHPDTVKSRKLLVSLNQDIDQST